MAEAALPELAAVPWRGRVDARYLRNRGWLWTLQTVAFVVPFTAAGVLLILLEPLSVPVALASFAHGWVIPELHAFRGSNTVRPKGPRNQGAEKVAQGLLGDLLGHEARDLQRETGLAMEGGDLGVWLLGEAGAVLVADGGRRVHCFCVGTTDKELPPSDRIAHLLLALRSDEEGFATVANHAFSGAPWRLRRRIRKEQRPALDAAVSAARIARRSRAVTRAGCEHGSQGAGPEAPRS